MKPALPNQMARGVEVRTKYAARHEDVTQSEIRSSPVYAGHAIKPLTKLVFGTRFLRGRLQSWTGSRRSGTPDNPCPHPSKATASPSFRAIHADVLKGMVSYRIGFSECVHRRASNRQHVRSALFNESLPTCQALNCPNLAGCDLPSGQVSRTA